MKPGDGTDRTGWRRTSPPDTFETASAKFDRDGTLLWKQNLNAAASFNDEAFSVALDRDGNVAAGGVTFNTRPLTADFTVLKLGR